MNYTFTKTIDIKMQIKFCGYLLQFYLHIMQFQTYKINCLCFLKKSKINKKEILRFFCNREGKKMSGIRGSNPRPSAWKADALPTELIPLDILWGEEDSNLRRRAPADLQSAPVGHFGIPP